MMLRWTGGQAGDILMHIIAQNKKVYLNFNPIEVSQSGQLVGKPIRDARYPTLTNLPYVQFDPVQKHTPIDYNQLRKDILQMMDKPCACFHHRSKVEMVSALRQRQ